jgi:chemotaxis protein MotB
MSRERRSTSSLARYYEDEPQPQRGAPAWFVTFADLMVLLMCFFVLMLSFSEMDEAKFKLMSGSLTETFGVQSELPAHEPPKGTSLEAQEFGPGAPEPTTEHEIRQHTVDSDLNTLDLGLELRLRELKAQEEAAERQANELRAAFRQEIDDGRLLIRQEGSNVVIQLLEKDSFPSGSAALESDARATLARIGLLVTTMSGAITVSGHTDDVPVRAGGQYRSNWELSAARAASVGHELLAAGLDPARLMVSGHADTQPRASNENDAGRSLNRRVDITFANGRERPGAWPSTPPSSGAASGP